MLSGGVEMEEISPYRVVNKSTHSFNVEFDQVEILSDDSESQGINLQLKFGAANI